MEWLTLATWIAVFLIAVPLAAGLAQGRVSLALQAVAASAGLVLIIVYLGTGDPQSLAWVATGAALVGLLAVAVGAASLVSDRVRTMSANSMKAEEHEATLAGVQLPLFGTALAVTSLVGLGVGT